MKCCFEWNALREIGIAPNNYFASIVLAGNTPYPATAGLDEYLFAGIVLPGKRLAGCGRSKRYHCVDRSGALEAAPSNWVVIKNNPMEITFKINTDLILDPGLLAASLSLDIANANGTTTHIPLNRSDVRIDWQSRGTFVITVARA
jgi:hypothetical protein